MQSHFVPYQNQQPKALFNSARAYNSSVGKLRKKEPSVGSLRLSGKLFFRNQSYAKFNNLAQNLIQSSKRLGLVRFSLFKHLPLPRHLVMGLQKFAHTNFHKSNLKSRIQRLHRNTVTRLRYRHHFRFSTRLRVAPNKGIPVRNVSKNVGNFGFASNSTLLPQAFLTIYLNQNHFSKSQYTSQLVSSLLHQSLSKLTRARFIVKHVSSSPSVTQNLFSQWLFNWSSLVSVYSSFFSLPRLNLYLLLKQARKVEVKHHLRLSFRSRRLFVILEDKAKQRTHLFASTGLFLKYFKQRKALKKNKSMRFLLMRFFRKILLTLGLQSVGVITRGIPTQLDTLLTALFRPLSHPFVNPLSGRIINEIADSSSSKYGISITSVLFSHPRPNVPQKVRKRGRIKRKIRRKIVRHTNLID